jgi:hypothetical protein
MDMLVRLLKRTGLGALYLVLSPLLAIGFVFFLIYGALTFIAVSLKSIYLFFSGRGVFTPFPEDMIAQKRYMLLQKQTPNQHKIDSQPTPTPTTGIK